MTGVGPLSTFVYRLMSSYETVLTTSEPVQLLVRAVTVKRPYRYSSLISLGAVN